MPGDAAAGCGCSRRWAAHGAGDVERAAAILAAGLEVADLREGERSVDRLWSAVFPERPLPAEYDFRMV